MHTFGEREISHGETTSGTCFQTALCVILYVRLSKSIQPQRVRALRLKMTRGYQRKGNSFLIGEDMNSIQLQKKPDMDVTLVRNVFLDEYMPEASGEFVKIYLYLLRCASGGKEISMGRIADIFEHTEKDVARALKYWEKMQLLSLTYDAEGNLTGIDFLEPSPKAAVLPEKPAFVAPPKVPLSPDRIAELKSHDDMEQLLFIAARYIGRPLTSTEIGNILYYYDSLHFSTDLIEYLVEYCVSKGNKSCHYMEKVALGWAEEGITSVQEAKNSTNLYHKKYYSVLNAFGIKGRGPARAEKEYIDRWTDTFHFNLDIIEEACNRTIAKTHSPSFAYADRILEDWSKKQVHHLNDIKPLDTEHAKNKGKKNPKTPPRAVTSNRFNNFDQREYDFDRLEKELLNH